MKSAIIILLFSICMLHGCVPSNQTKPEEETNLNENEISEDYLDGKQKSEELINEMENIDWEQNYDDAKEKGREAAAFLNELLK